MVHPIIAQASYYFIVMLLTIFLLGMFMRGFLFKFIRVKLSFGKLILVKIRGINRDYFAVSYEIDKEAIRFKDGKDFRTVPVKDSSVFYRAMGVTWVDYDRATNSFVKPDFTAIDANDPVIFDELVQRALYKPPIENKKEIILIILSILIFVGILAIIFLLIKTGKSLEACNAGIEVVKTYTHPNIVPTPGVS